MHHNCQGWKLPPTVAKITQEHRQSQLHHAQRRMNLDFSIMLDRGDQKCRMSQKGSWRHAGVMLGCPAKEWWQVTTPRQLQAGGITACIPLLLLCSARGWAACSPSRASASGSTGRRRGSRLNVPAMTSWMSACVSVSCSSSTFANRCSSSSFSVCTQAYKQVSKCTTTFLPFH